MAVARESRGSPVISRNHRTLFQIGAQNLIRSGLQDLYLRAGILWAKPTRVVINITNRCFFRCQQCDLWKEGVGDRWTELTRDEWLRILGEIRQWLGPTHVQFGGGEPLMRRDVLDLLRFCASHQMLCGIVTNGWYVDRRMAQELVGTGIFNVNLSLDGGRAETHDGLRGFPRSFERVAQAASYLRASRKELRADLRIVIKTTIWRHNLDELLPLLEWVEGEGLDGLHLGPLEQSFGQDEDPLWYTRSPLWPNDLKKLDAVLDALTRRKASSAALLNTASHLQSMKDYFRDPNRPGGPDFRCRVGVDQFRIAPDGGVELCPYMGPIGYLSKSRPEEIWKSLEAAKNRSAIDVCKKDCLTACIYQRNLGEKVGLFLNILRAKS
jgi:MoaA/NifB/PqqE/SkfB family radical SAM enzyme